MLRFLLKLIDFFVCFVAAHFAQCVFEHDILLEEVVDGHFSLRIVVHRAFEEEAQEALCAIATCACSQVAEQHEVEAERSCKDGIATKEVDFNLHRMRIDSNVESLLTSFVWKLAGSSSTSPSRLPKMFVENHPDNPKQRVPMIGAKPDLTKVCPVLKSFPAIGIFVFSANSHMAGMSTVVFGAPMMKGAPSERAAYA